MQEKLCRYSKYSFSSNYFIANNSHMETESIYSYTVVFNVQAILYFWDNFHLLKHYPKKEPQNCFDSFNNSNKTGMQISTFSFALDKSLFKVSVNCRSKIVM